MKRKVFQSHRTDVSLYYIAPARPEDLVRIPAIELAAASGSVRVTGFNQPAELSTLLSVHTESDRGWAQNWAQPTGIPSVMKSGMASVLPVVLIMGVASALGVLSSAALIPFADRHIIKGVLGIVLLLSAIRLTPHHSKSD